MIFGIGINMSFMKMPDIRSTRMAPWGVPKMGIEKQKLILKKYFPFFGDYPKKEMNSYVVF